MKKLALLLLTAILLSSCDKEKIEIPFDFIIEIPNHVTTFGGDNGQIFISSMTGTEPFTFTLKDHSGKTIAPYSACMWVNLIAGSYEVAGEDASQKTLTKPVTITQPGPPPLQFTVAVTNVSGVGLSNGKITVTVTSGAPPYTYSLEGGASNNTGEFLDLAPGTYNVTVTDNEKQTVTKSAVIPGVSPLQFTVTTTPVTTFGVNDGKITFNVSSGMPSYTYKIQKEGSAPVTQVGVGVFSNLTAGTYYCTVTDSYGQNETKVTEVTQPHPAPKYTKELIDCGSASYDARGALSAEVSEYVGIFQNNNKYSISFWYNTPTDALNKKYPINFSTAKLLATDQSENAPGENQITIEINKARMVYNRPPSNITLTSSTAWKGLHHMVILYDGSNMKMYIDNVLINSVASSSKLIFNKMYIGGDYGWMGDYYDYAGTISKFKIYDIALPEDEIDYLYNH